jgi:DNA-binding beta-propeller fold protein YncE
MMSEEEVPVSQPIRHLPLRACTTVVLIVPALWLTLSALAQEAKPPRYEVDAGWPKPLPNNWLLGQVGGLAVDKHDHIWVNQRPRTLTDDEKGAIPNPPTRTSPRSICCKPAPSVMEFDAEGNLLEAWGGPEDTANCKAPMCIWPESEHGIFVDDDDHVWVAGNGPNDRMLLEFTLDGKFLMMIGGSFAGPPDSNSRNSVGRAAGIFVDSDRNEVYLADGYLNSRVVKFNAQTGAFLKDWGAYGRPPVDPPASPPPANPTAIYSQQPPNENSPAFNRPVHCVVLSRDGLVYVCDRSNNRIQVFNREGEYQQQFVFDPATRGLGSVWSLALSPDKDQQYLIYADGENNLFRVVDRKSGATLATYGRSGRNAGQFHWVHQIAVDSKGNVYTGEVDTAKRLQKFVAAAAR